MIDKLLVESIVCEQLNSETEFVVDISISANNAIIVLIDSDVGITIEKCIVVSKAIEQALDRDKEDFELEVSSAGLSSPLKVYRQYKKNVGSDLEVITLKGIKVVGKLLLVNENGFTLEIEEMIKLEGKKRKEKVVRQENFSYSQIKSAKVVIAFR